MAAYFNTNQLRLTMKELVKIYMSDCEECNELSQDCMDLLKHNFQAEYAVYNKQTKAVEIGINKTEDDFNTYPQIEVYSFPIKEIGKKIDHSFKHNQEDLEFYGKLIGRKKGLGSNSVVLLD
ncbi:hypothetical protein [uncultured Christiangramia sp.]|uniref:hypothetical protein n=1 Tax=uncultured Christiangramia sp. TaxID=503836 RepID=UPI00260D4327|nr:hypothetical protein [uncultured Christiangramia sp.]